MPRNTLCKLHKFTTKHLVVPPATCQKLGVKPRAAPVCTDSTEPPADSTGQDPVLPEMQTLPLHQAEEFKSAPASSSATMGLKA